MSAEGKAFFSSLYKRVEEGKILSSSLRERGLVQVHVSLLLYLWKMQAEGRLHSSLHSKKGKALCCSSLSGARKQRAKLERRAEDKALLLPLQEKGKGQDAILFFPK